jgi:hypothetical protein
MAVGITPDTLQENPYLTVQEYKDAPTSIDYNNLVVGGNQAAQDAELANVILRASSYMNEYLNQSLVADQYTETQRVRVNGQGMIALHPNNSPIISLSSFQYGADPNNLVALPDCSTAWFEAQQLIIPLSNLGLNYSSQGPLGFGFGYSPRQQLFTEYTYVSGFVNTTIATATAGATSLTVADGTGIIAGQPYRIYDGSKSERITVASTYTNGSTTVPLTSALAFTHAAGVAIGNMPNAIKEACILITTAFLKVRGDNSMTMNLTTQPTVNIGNNARYSGEIALALDMVNKYRRIR